MSPEISRARLPQALGEDIDVPFIRMLPWSVQPGTGATAPPGARMSPPASPSVRPTVSHESSAAVGMTETKAADTPPVLAPKGAASW